MHTLIKTLLAIVLSTQVFGFSNLILDVDDHHFATYVITIGNGSTYETTSDFTISNLAFGNHKIVIHKKFKGVRQSPETGQFKGTRSKKILIYNGFINIPQRSNVYASVKQRNLMITEIVPTAASQQTRPNQPRSGCAPITRQGNRGHGKRRAQLNTNHHHYSMGDMDFNNLLQTINSASFDKGKLKLLRPAVAANYFTSAQIVQLVGAMTFESNKLELAKMAYPHTIDKGNYFLVNNAFVFQSTKKKLSKHIKNRG